MRRRLSVLLLLLVACSGESTGPGVPGDLGLQRTRWDIQGIRNYDFAVTYGNEWFAPLTHRIEVRQGLVSRVLDATGSAVVPGARGMTLDTLFAVALRKTQDPENVVVLLFHPKYHYPTRVDADAPNWADDREWFVVSEFRRR